ncbi:MAG TPA: DUF3108 domain-containing protein [Longimicrobium sp.]|nr:DUF3108 domain-containing protein [Longimicrobium sp.]
MTTIRNTTRRLALAFATAALLPAVGGAAQPSPPELPFAPGESFTYRGSTRLGRIGTGTMTIEGTEAVRGRDTWVLRFDFRGRVGPAGVEDHTRSWLDPRALASMRFTKRERSPIGSRTQDVQMFPDTRRWRGADGGGEGAMPTDAPLDELSFIYYLRTLPLKNGDVYRLDRHYEAGRNPVVVRVIGRGPIQVPAGRYQTIEVEMRVKDARYRGEGVIQFHFTDDARRIPVRIESQVPVAGRMVLSLQGQGGA